MQNRDPEGSRLPIKIDTTSNGEFSPIPLEKRNIAGNAFAHEWAGENARRKGASRRDFMVSACGAATSLLAVNHANAMAKKTGGKFDLPEDAALDVDAAMEALGGNEFIFDVQGHYVNPEGAWLRNVPEGARPLAGMPNACVREAGTDDLEYLQCLRAEEFIKDVFMDSDTDMMVLSFVPSTRDAEPLTIEEADQTRRIIDAMEGDHRLLLHGRVNPNQDGDLDDMDRLAENFPISAWKTYTQWGPNGAEGFFMTDDFGEAMIAKAKSLGIKNIAIHKGIPFGPTSYRQSTCEDIGEAAKRHPDINFILYHSGYDMSVPEEAFTPGAGKSGGIDVLCQSLIDHGIAPGSNVYAELGSTWRFLMRDPDQAAHLLGKLIKYCGENNVLWGTDSIWYGSPQDQIQAFRTFQISDEYAERFGYAKLTPQVKAKIFGLNAMKPYNISMDEAVKRASNDALSQRRHAYLERPDPSFATYGPKNRREFLYLKSIGG
ncbi:amidohydrolase family protein [Hyphococcus flavus]|uniref:Amidohydrolase family protein n=1 Tax=Hyphococcus flavus TaxID=1866326 RepID=A0AAE9ZBT3_9PROT|nr:amidohydrolase family protein [Hyphococcus flavus]WDI31819.1 amidohydrolase family protein [Hyphococcus flavus]